MNRTKHRFRVYDLVHIKKDLPSHMSHFPCDKNAIITRYNHNMCQIGNEFEHSYSLCVEGENEVSWYNDQNLTLVKRLQKRLLSKWIAEEKERSLQQGKLSWIFEHGKDVLDGASEPTIKALAGCLGFSNLYGDSGSIFVYYENARRILLLAEPFLSKNNMGGWVSFASGFKRVFYADVLPG